jgi:flagella basal body P-ring formation protein FlgA
VLLAVCAGTEIVSVAAGISEETVRQAIVRAVERRVGPAARVSVRNLVVDLGNDADGSVFASVPSDTRAGVPARVPLKVRRADGRMTRYGEATCVIDVTVAGLRARRPVSRGRELLADDLEAAEVDVTGLPLLPPPGDLAGARAMVDIAAGQLIQRSMVVPAPLVRTGDEVAVTVRRGPVVVEGRGIAAQSGRLGDVIHVVNPGSRRRIAARVTARGSVEVEHGR